MGTVGNCDYTVGNSSSMKYFIEYTPLWTTIIVLLWTIYLLGVV